MKVTSKNSVSIKFVPMVIESPSSFNNVQKQPSRGALKKRCSEISSKSTGEHPCRSAILIKLQSNFIEISLQHGCSPLNLLHIFRTPLPKNTCGWLLLNVIISFLILSRFGRFPLFIAARYTVQKNEVFH